MKKSLILAAMMLAFAALPVHAAAPKSYQVTGPVLAIDADKITVQKGSEKWEIAVGSAAVPAGVKVGSKVTIQYTMTAATIAAK